MALSNMGREPRREWTEQLFGLVVLLVLIGAYIAGLRWLWGVTNMSREDRVASTALGLLVYALALLALFGLWYLAHEFGEWACDMLKSAGLDPRPKRRY